MFFKKQDNSLEIEKIVEENRSLKEKLKEAEDKIKELEESQKKSELIIAENRLKTTLLHSMTDGCSTNIAEIQNDIIVNHEKAKEMVEAVNSSDGVINALESVALNMSKTVDDMSISSNQSREIANNLNTSVEEIGGIISS